MAKHWLKTWPRFFAAVETGIKRFEIRRKDRDFKIGDLVVLEEWEPETEAYSGRKIDALITYVTDFEQKPDFIVFGFLALPPASPAPPPPRNE